MRLADRVDRIVRASAAPWRACACRPSDEEVGCHFVLSGLPVRAPRRACSATAAGSTRCSTSSGQPRARVLSLHAQPVLAARGPARRHGAQRALADRRRRAQRRARAAHRDRARSPTASARCSRAEALLPAPSARGAGGASSTACASACWRALDKLSPFFARHLAAGGLAARRSRHLRRASAGATRAAGRLDDAVPTPCPPCTPTRARAYTAPARCPCARRSSACCCATSRWCPGLGLEGTFLDRLVGRPRRDALAEPRLDEPRTLDEGRAVNAVGSRVNALRRKLTAFARLSVSMSSMQPTGEAPRINLHQLLRAMVDKGASDLHITTGSPPQLRIDGSLVPLKVPPLTPHRDQAALLLGADRRAEGRSSRRRTSSTSRSA